MGEIIMMMGLSVVILLLVVFAIILVVSLVSRRNARYPVLTESATVVAKRIHIRNSDGDSYTQYYATFRLENGDCLELLVARALTGDLAEGDKGKLTFQGTRFLGFERT